MSLDWGLPVGCMELGESLEETAKRELLKKRAHVMNHLVYLQQPLYLPCYPNRGNGQKHPYR